MTEPIKTVWAGWANKDKCPLCGIEGKSIANMLKKGQKRANGILLETGLSYCMKCIGTEECDKHWNNWWNEQWVLAENIAEENWKKHGVYTNVQGGYGMPSFYFGSVKTENGLKRYLSVYPDCPRYKLTKDIGRCRDSHLVDELIENAAISQEYKDIVRAEVKNNERRIAERAFNKVSS